jgi:hypothetical protein
VSRKINPQHAVAGRPEVSGKASERSHIPCCWKTRGSQ